MFRPQSWFMNVGIHFNKGKSDVFAQFRESEYSPQPLVSLASTTSTGNYPRDR